MSKTTSELIQELYASRETFDGVIVIAYEKGHDVPGTLVAGRPLAVRDGLLGISQALLSSIGISLQPQEADDSKLVL